MKKLLVTLAATSALFALSTGAAFAANLVSNGSFENGIANPGPFIVLNAGDNTSVTNWTVNSGTVDYISTYWTASDGSRSLDMSGNDAGSISQVITTTIGQTYNLTFDLSGNPDGGPAVKDLQVSATGAAPQDFTYDTSAHGNSDANMMWAHQTYTFTATANSTTLTFASQTAGFFGPALDNVAVNATAPVCTPTGFYRDNINLTAAIIDPLSPVTGNVDATGCNIGVFFGTGNNGSVNGANVHGANYFGVLVQQAAVDVTNSTINQIGENPLNGDQHGVGIYYTTVGNGSAEGNGSCTADAVTTGTASGNTITNYQKGGIVANCAGTNVAISDNTVTGQGPVSYIAQNGIQIGYGGTGSITGNTVTGNYCTDANPGDNCTASPTAGNPNADGSAGILLYSPGSGVNISNNTLTGNQYSVWTVGAPDLTATGNTITGTGGTTDSGIAISNTDQWGATPAGTTGSIDHNTITNTNYGVLVQDYGATGSNESTIAVNRNSLAGNTSDGLWTNNLVANTVDGTCNWWGNASGPGPVGPGSGSDVTANVNFSPWLASSDLNGGCTGGLPVSVITNSATSETTSSATLNGTDGAVPGDNISFWWGTTPISGLTPGGNVAEFPASNWNHDSGLGPIGAGGTFNESVTGLTAGTTYYFVAWVQVGGIWYPASDVLSFVVPTTAGMCPAPLVPAASALETVTVHSASDTATPSFNTLASGQPYLLEASGTWNNTGGPNLADAMYSSFDSWTHYQEGQDATPYFLGPDEFNLEVNGQFANWGPYDGTNHAYSMAYTGTSAPVNFLVFDGNSNSGASAINTGWYGDNNGTLSVSIYQCVVPPPPADACSTPNSAPAGYTLVKGTTANQTITLAPNTMFVSKGNGNNRITGNGDGNYIICTGSGNDTITLGNGADTVTDTGGNNTIRVGDGDMNITTGSGNDTITAGAGTDAVNAGGGNNNVTAGNGNNTVTSGAGNDTITVGNGNNTVNGGNGNNTVNAGTGVNTITTGGGNDKITTQATGNTINAGGGNNTVHQL